MKLTDLIKDVGQAVTFFPGIAKMLGREECLFIVQMLYWKREDRDWTWKSQSTIETFTSLSKREQRRVRQTLVDQKILREKHVRRENRIYFQVDEKRLNELWDAFRASNGTSLAKLRYVTTQVTVRHLVPSEKNRENIIRENTKEPARGFSDVPSFEQKCVKHLLKTIQLSFKITKDGKGWDKSFSQLQRFNNVPKERIKAALKWYRQNAGKKYVPVIEDAKTFRNKFISIEARMKDDGEEVKEKIEISEDAKKILTQLEDLGWPANCGEENLAELIQLSLDSYQKLWRKLTRFARRYNVRDSENPAKLVEFDATTHQETKYCTFHGEIGAAMLTYPTKFVLGWFERVNEKLRNWQGWSGKLSQFVFSETHPEFVKRGRSEAKEYSGDAKLWDDYITTVNES